MENYQETNNVNQIKPKDELLADFVVMVRQAYYSNALKITIPGFDKNRLKALALQTDSGLEGLIIAAEHFDVKKLKALPESVRSKWFNHLEEDATLAQLDLKIKKYSAKIKCIETNIKADRDAAKVFPLIFLVLGLLC